MNRFDRIVSVLLTAAAVVVALVLVKREITPSAPLRVELGAREPVFHERWEDRLSDRNSYRVGPWPAPVRVAVFFDLECPFCARFDEDVLQPLMDWGEPDVSVALIHLPLRMHRFAVVAANALECARDQEVGDRFRQLVFRQQDSLGLKDFQQFADEVGVEDEAEFERCISAPTDRVRVTEGRRLALDLGLSGAPAVFVNEWQLGQPPGANELRKMIFRVRQGLSPVEDASP